MYITTQKIKSTKQGEEGSPIREAKVQPLLPCTSLCPQLPQSLPAVRDPGRAQPGRSGAARTLAMAPEPRPKPALPLQLLFS